MAIYHLSVKTISRSAGRSATAAAAYRAAVAITDMRTGEHHDYRRKRGVESAQIILPAAAPAWAGDRASLWNAAENSETRKNSTVAREFEIALPSELSDSERQRLAIDFAREIVERHGCVADVAIHGPGKGGDERNHHAHILCTTRRLGLSGFGEKTRELDDRKTGEVEYWRERFATLQNERLKEFGVAERVDHRSLEAQGIDRIPTQHLGPAASAFERRTGEASRKRIDFEQEALARLVSAKAAGDLEREEQELIGSIIDLSSDLAAAKQARNRDLADIEKWKVSEAFNRIKEIKSRQTTKGIQSHENGRKSDSGIWTIGRHGDAFEIYELNAFANQPISQAQSINDLRDLSSIDVVPGRLRGEVLLSSDAADQLANGEPDGLEALRRNTAGKRSVSQLGRDLQRIKRQIGASSIVQSAGEDKPHLDGLSKEKLGQLLVEQLMNTELDVRKSREHERDKPGPP